MTGNHILTKLAQMSSRNGANQFECNLSKIVILKINKASYKPALLSFLFVSSFNAVDADFQSNLTTLAQNGAELLSRGNGGITIGAAQVTLIGHVQPGRLDREE